MKKFFIIATVLVAVLFSACSDESEKPPVDLNKNKQIEIRFTEISGVKTIPVKLNGVSMDMIFDTGCSGIHLSMNEIITMYKNGKFTDSDIIGTTYSQIADGSVVENAVIRLKTVEIGGEKGILLKNIDATIAMNQEAPILLGNGVLDKMGSYTIDNRNKKIIFRRK